MNIIEKLLEARKMIKETSVKKEGKNTFSKYDYFTPSQVSELVNTVCQELKMIPVFSLRKDKYGLYGVLSIINLEKLDNEGSVESIKTEMRTEIPKITATNETQQMGGCETYTKRYMLMSAFDITDNNLDFDSQDNRPKGPPPAAGGESKPQFDESDSIALEILACTQQSQLNELWGKLSKEEKEKFLPQFTNQKEKVA